MKRFREQREASDKQREQVQKIVEGWRQGCRRSRRRCRPLAQFRMNETMDQLIKLVTHQNN